MIGLALLAIGAVLLWAAFTKRGDSVLSALNINLPAAGASSTGTNASGGGSGGTTHGAMIGGSDIGTHAGIDANGNIITIDKPYGSMTDAEKDAANKFAKQIGNLGSTV